MHLLILLSLLLVRLAAAQWGPPPTKNLCFAPATTNRNDGGGACPESYMLTCDLTGGCGKNRISCGVRRPCYNTTTAKGADCCTSLVLRASLLSF
jgi:hypothetical protein